MGKQRRMARRQCVFDAIVDQQQQQHAGHHHPTHCHELVDDDEKFELTVDVPGVKEENIDIKLEDGMLTVQGQRTASSESSQFTSKFSKTFSLDKTVDVDKMSAALKNGVLTVSAPKDLKKLEENIRRIPPQQLPPSTTQPPPTRARRMQALVATTTMVLQRRNNTKRRKKKKKPNQRMQKRKNKLPIVPKTEKSKLQYRSSKK